MKATKEKVEVLKSNLIKHFNIVSPNELLVIDIHTPIMIGEFIEVIRFIFPGNAVTINKKISSGFVSRWAAEEWQNFEQLCKDNL